MRELTDEEILQECPETINLEQCKLQGKRRLLSKINVRKGGGKHRKRKWFPAAERIKAATVYAITGNAARTSEITGIPACTIRQWKRREWWLEVMRRIQREKDDELDVKITKIIDKAVDQINDRIVNGDYIYDNRKGELIRIPVKAKDAANVTATLVDKRTSIRNRVEQKQSQDSVSEKLALIAEKFQELIRATQGKKAIPDVIEGEIVVERQENVEQTGGKEKSEIN